jgi:uncharacterized metal-binding protein YceD (DUF177 family)
MTPEFSRWFDVRTLSERPVTLTASTAEREALARRFGLLAVDRLEAELTLRREKEVVAVTGQLTASVVQSCAVSGEPLPVTIEEPIALEFVPATRSHRPDEEIELAAQDCDQIEFTGSNVDLGEAVAQSLALAIDPYATGPQADAARARHGLLGEEAAGPFAALAALKKP